MFQIGKRNSKKANRFGAILLVLILLFTLVGCGGEAEEVTRVTLPSIEGERMVLEKAGALATRQYIIARLKTDALIEYDINTGSIDELKAMIDDTAEAWRLCELASTKTSELVEYAQSMNSSEAIPSAMMVESKSKVPSLHLLTTIAYASEENAAVKWAKELTGKFDSYPAGQKIKQLSENLGTDAKNAFAQLKMAQALLEGDAYNKQADVEQQIEHALMATKTACKTGLYVGGVIASGGTATGILEAGGMIIGGVDTIVDIAATGSNIILGEKNMVTMAANDLKDVVGPIASVAGGINIIGGGALTEGFKAGATVAEKMGSLDKLTYIGESVLDFANDGNILGGMVTVGDDGKTTVTMNEISLEGKTPDEVAKELKDTGLPVPEEVEPKTAAELAEEMEEEFTLTETELNEIMENLRSLLTEIFLESSEEPVEEPAEGPSEQDPPEALPVSGLSMDKILGTYDILMSSDESNETDDGSITLTKDSSGNLMDHEGNTWSYDPSSSTAAMKNSTGDFQTTYTLVFKEEGGSISCSGTMIIDGTNMDEERVTLTIYVAGNKVD